MDFFILSALIIMSLTAIGFAVWIFRAEDKSSLLDIAQSQENIRQEPVISSGLPIPAAVVNSTAGNTCINVLPTKYYDLDPAFQRDKFLINQRHFSMSEKYYVYSEEGDNILYVERSGSFKQSVLIIFKVIFLVSILMYVPMLYKNQIVTSSKINQYLFSIFFLPFWWIGNFRRDIFVYSDDTKKEKKLEIQHANPWISIRSKYIVKDENGNPLAYLRRLPFLSYLQRQWEWRTPDNILRYKIMEDSVILSLLRRVVPFGEFFITNFVIIDIFQNKIVGEFQRKFTVGDKYILDLSLDTEKSIDRRAALAVGVMLDTCEGR